MAEYRAAPQNEKGEVLRREGIFQSMSRSNCHVEPAALRKTACALTRIIWWFVAGAVVLSCAGAQRVSDPTDVYVTAPTGAAAGDAVQVASRDASQQACSTTSVSEVVEPRDSGVPDLLYTFDRAEWDAKYLTATAVTFDESIRLRDILYGPEAVLGAGITRVHLGRQRSLGVLGNACMIAALRPAIEAFGIMVTELPDEPNYVPLTPNFEPVWRCPPDEVLERPTHSEQPSIQLALEWGTDQSGMFLNAVLNITITGRRPSRFATITRWCSMFMSQARTR